jgi:hypothetical protein
MQSNISPRILYGGIAILLVVVGAVGYAMWRDSQTHTIEFTIGDDSVQISES